MKAAKFAQTILTNEFLQNNFFHSTGLLFRC